MIIDYTKSGFTIQDYKIENTILQEYQIHRDSILRTSSELFILATRALIAEGKLDHKKVEFQFEGESIGFADANGKLPFWPKGYCEYTDDFLNRILFKDR